MEEGVTQGVAARRRRSLQASLQAGHARHYALSMLTVCCFSLYFTVAFRLSACVIPSGELFLPCYTLPHTYMHTYARTHMCAEAERLVRS